MLCLRSALKELCAVVWSGVRYAWQLQCRSLLHPFLEVQGSRQRCQSRARKRVAHELGVRYRGTYPVPRFIVLSVHF
jgi:hypothetical protein